MAQLEKDRLQDGIYFRPKGRPGRAYRLLLLDVKPNTRPAEVRDAIATVWAMLQDLCEGIVADLRPIRNGDPDIHVEPSKLSCLLGFGASLFQRARSLTPNGERPAELVPLGHGSGQPFPSLQWSADERRTGEADLALQFIAETELAVSRAVVEVYNLIHDRSLPLAFVTFHGGFNREDVRSWLNFHDGLSNIDPRERRTAIEVTLKEPPWMAGGTYMAFLRLTVDLAAWRRLSREDQEVLVGRHKLTGCPLESVAPGGRPVPVPGCPFTGDPLGSSGHVDPRQATDPIVGVSHIHRVNPTRMGPDEDGSNRIFRQGYEFLESLADGHLRVGLNFVSFQRNLARFTSILTRPGWLQTVNFGGRARRGAPAPIQLASIIAGGYYAVPPQGPPFPGADIFRSK